MEVCFVSLRRVQSLLLRMEKHGKNRNEMKGELLGECSGCWVLREPNPSSTEPYSSAYQAISTLLYDQK